MPGYDTHYLFGIQVYRKMPVCRVKNDIRLKKDAYVLGMLGPDIFFYYATEVVAIRKNIGSTMHTTKTNAFLMAMLDYVSGLNERQNSVEVAYLAGFMTHYFLDVKCHPYVYWETDYLHKKPGYLKKHYQFENDIDIALLRIMRNTTPYEFSSVSEIKINKADRDRVCRMLYYAIHQVYPKSRITITGIRLAIASVQREQKLLRSAPSKLKTILQNVEETFNGQHSLASLVPSVDHEISPDPLNLAHRVWSNPWKTDKKSKESVPDMMETAGSQTALLFHMLEDYLYEFPKDRDIYRTLSGKIGNLSYHSGLDCKIPS